MQSPYGIFLAKFTERRHQSRRMGHQRFLLAEIIINIQEKLNRRGCKTIYCCKQAALLENL